MTVESMFSMNSATATISGTARSFSFDCMRGSIGFSVGRLFEAVAEPSAGCWNFGSSLSAWRKSAIAPSVSPIFSRIRPRVENALAELPSISMA